MMMMMKLKAYLPQRRSTAGVPTYRQHDVFYARRRQRTSSTTSSSFDVSGGSGGVEPRHGELQETDV